MAFITIGAGKKGHDAVIGELIELRSDVPLAVALIEALQRLRPRREAWFSGHRWKDNHRSNERWISTWLVGIDVDHEIWDPEEKEMKHVPPPPEADDEIQRLVQTGGLPGNVFYVTPRGFRIVFVLDEPIADKAAYTSAFDAAADICAEAIAGAQLPGFRVDMAVRDLARMLFTPNAIVDGVARKALPVLLRSASYRADELVSKRPPMVDNVRPLRPAPTDEIAAAIEKYNRESTREYPRSSGECPVCGHKDCFGTVPDSDPPRWSCFSANHSGAGKKSDTEACWTGDALDLDCFESRTTIVEQLRAKGYIGERRRATQTPPPEPPEPGSDFEPEEKKEESKPAGATVLENAFVWFTAAELMAPPPRQEFILHPYIPADTVTTLAGPGGSNKTTLLTYLAVCRALGIPFFNGIPPRRGRTVILSTEDGRDDYRRKLAAIRDELGDRFDAEAVANNVALIDLPGEPVRLVAADKGNFMPTGFADELAAALKAKATGTDLVIMETVSRLAGGIETNESLSILVESCQRVCKIAKTAIVLVAHVSQEAARQGFADAYTARGGSALGDNGRSSIVLTRLNEKNKDVFAKDADITPEEMQRTLVLAHAKSNGAEPARPILLERVYTPYAPALRVAAMRTTEDNSQEKRDRLCRIVAELTRDGVTVSERRIETTYSGDIGCSQKDVRRLIDDAVRAGDLAKRPYPGGRGEMLVPSSQWGMRQHGAAEVPPHHAAPAAPEAQVHEEI